MCFKNNTRKEETRTTADLNTHYRWFDLLQLSTKLKKDYVQEPWENRFCSLLLFEVREINRFLESCHRDPRKILQASRYSSLEPLYSILDSFKDWGSSFESRLSPYICTVLYAKFAYRSLSGTVANKINTNKMDILLQPQAALILFFSSTSVCWVLSESKAPVSQLVNADDTSVIEIKTQLYLES